MDLYGLPFFWNLDTNDRQVFAAMIKEQKNDQSAARIDENEKTGTPLINKGTVSQLRQTVPQVLAVTVPSLLFLNMGMTDAFPSVVISATNDESINSSLHLSTEEASWYGSLMYIMQPIGSLTSGVLLQTIGCKNLMVYLHIPLIGSWLMIYFAATSTALCASAAFSGFAKGLIFPPNVRYISEVSHPSIRIILMTYASLFIPIGNFFIYSLAAITDWRHVALISALTSIICIFLLSWLLQLWVVGETLLLETRKPHIMWRRALRQKLLQIPETPMWLMSKGRLEDALKSLRWLRGWTSPEMVKDEYKKLQFYSRKTPNTLSRRHTKEDARVDAGKYSTLGGNTVGMDDKIEQQLPDSESSWQHLTNGETLVLLTKCIVLYVLIVFSARLVMQPYQLQIFAEINLPMNPNTISMILSLISVVGAVGSLFLVKLTGKKPLGIFSFAMSSICLGLIGVYIMLLRSMSEHVPFFYRWCAVILFAFNNFANTVGVQSFMMTYLGEILPYRGRGITTGIVNTIYCVTLFLGVKTFPAMEIQLGLSGIFFLYAVISVVGVFFVCFILPETDDRFLSDIEIDLTKSKTHGTFKNNQKR